MKKLKPPRRSQRTTRGARGQHSADSAAKTRRRSDPALVVGLGVSAGGLEALEEFFHAMPVASGFAFIVVSHQHPTQPNLLPELLAKRTAMTVREVRDRAVIEANCVYVSRPGCTTSIQDHVLRLVDFTVEPGGVKLPIDALFRSLAETYKDRAVGVVLSGTGADGTLGVKAIKGAAGLTLAQAPSGARYTGMPQSAASSGLVDHILPAGQIPERLARYAEHVSHALGAPALTRGEEAALPAAMQRILVLLRKRTRHDFSTYKPSTIRRRIERRVTLHQFKNAAAYAQHLQEQPEELDQLFKELLIGVTMFFRDPEAFSNLIRGPLLQLVANATEGTSIRVWVPGCSSGEEAFSLAIALHECCEKLDKYFNVQIFATDLDDEAIATARNGLYPEGIAADLTPERLNTYFVREDAGFRIRADVREMLVFAPQNITQDPPFTKVDLISCRNLLIYLNADMQRKLLTLFHYALKPEGILFLGPSENITSAAGRFLPIDMRWKIYRRKSSTAENVPPEKPEARKHPRRLAREPKAEAAGNGRSLSTASTIERILLSRHVPPCLVINRDGEILYLHGRTGDFLKPAGDQPRVNILEIAREGLRVPLSAAIRDAVTRGGAASRTNIRVKTTGAPTYCDLAVSLLHEPESVRGLLLVTLQPHGGKKTTPAPRPSPSRSTARTATGQVRELARELQYTRESLQTTVQELEASNELMKSTNEEQQSTNEELQSANEELETSKEEMQSLNEELQTVNAQLQSKLEELTQTNDDMQNLLNSTEIATIFLDEELRIRRFTSEARQMVKLIATDIGRPISDLAANLEYDRLEQDAAQVMRTLVFMEREVRTKDGDWRLMRIMPYRTTENVIVGLVITFLDINRIKRAEIKADLASKISSSVVSTMRELVLVLDPEHRVLSGNPAFHQTSRLGALDVEGRSLFELGGGRWNFPALREAVQTMTTTQRTIENLELTAPVDGEQPRDMIVNGTPLLQSNGDPGRYLLVIAPSHQWQKPHPQSR